MKLLRLLLLPFSLIYYCITQLRNLLYDTKIFKSYSFKEKIIAIGNLSTGGTGKSPQAEYLIRLLKDSFTTATLSRGYKRKSTGFVLAQNNADAAQLGDEPYQFHTKFPGITVAVDTDRVNGVQRLLQLKSKPEVIILDDAYQHRRIKAGFYILLTAYADLYADDFLLPAGNLRESRAGAGRADVIIVTKCPGTITKEERAAIIKKLRPASNQQVFFTHISYDSHVFSAEGSLSVETVKAQKKILVAGIAKPQPFFNYLSHEGDILKKYPDHHDFTDTEINELQRLSAESIIITTEKDYMRLKGRLPAARLYYLPICSAFIEGGNEFDKIILDYVGKSTGNS